MTITISQDIMFFFCIQLLNVILSTIKSILTINGSPKIASIANAIYFTLYAYVIKLIVTEELIVVLIVTFITNLIGVYLGKIILEYFEKDKLWIYTCFFECNENSVIKLAEKLAHLDIECVYTTIMDNKLYEIKILTDSKEESRLVVNLLKNNKIKYYITESI